MKFLNILYLEYYNKDPKKAMYDAADEMSCLASFYSSLGTNLKDETVKSVLCIAVNTEGYVLAMQRYSKEAESKKEVEES